MHPALKATLFKGGGVNLPAFMAAQSDGLWYDSSKTDRMFQEDVGPTPADDANEVIGLALSQRTTVGQTLAQVIAAATELRGSGAPALTGTATAASYDTSTGAGTVYRVNGSNLSSVAISGLVSGRTYRLDLEATSATAVLVRPSSATSLAAVSIAGNTRQAAFVTAADGAVHITSAATNPATATFTLHSLKEVSHYPAAQSTAGFKPKYQTTGATFDATDDNLLTAYTAQNGANFIIAYVDVPATLAATQVMAGASGSAANRCFLAFNTSGQLCAGVGSDSTATIVGTTDWRSQSVVVALGFDGTTVKLFAGTAEEYSAAQNSTPTTAIPFRIGALNNNGTAGSFSGVALKDLLVGRQALTLAQFKSIRTQLISGA